MLFILLIMISFILGILACIPLASLVSPPAVSLLIVLFVPWLTLYFFSQHSFISDIRDMYLSFIIGMCCYWTYFETIKKMKGN